MSKFNLLVPMLLCIACLNITCKDSGINIFDKSFTLTTEDASCTEVWLRIKVGPGNTSREVTLKRDTTVLFTRTLNDLETVVIDTSLIPSHTYTYTAQLLNGSKAVNSTAHTMDTTSHNFTWQTFTLGDGISSSSLHDVAIINDTCIWAVGEIYQGGITYNVAKWNGSAWSLYQLYYNGNNLIVPIRGIYLFGTNDIWLAAGGVFHWDGVSSQTQLSFSRLTLPDANATIEKLWGSSSSDLYGVGNAGTIVHYNGSSWTKIESGTSLNINDIYGSWNSETGKYEILCVASNVAESFEREIIKIDGIDAQILNKNGVNYTLSSVWFKPGRKYYAVGDGLFIKSSLDQALWKDTRPSSAVWHIYKLRGRALNDIVTAGGGGEILHYNGKTWKSYYDETRLSSGNYYSIAIRGNMVIAVGENAPQAVILMGQR